MDSLRPGRPVGRIIESYLRPEELWYASRAEGMERICPVEKVDSMKYMVRHAFYCNTHALDAKMPYIVDEYTKSKDIANSDEKKNLRSSRFTIEAYRFAAEIIVAANRGRAYVTLLEYKKLTNWVQKNLVHPGKIYDEDFRLAAIAQDDVKQLLAHDGSKDHNAEYDEINTAIINDSRRCLKAIMPLKLHPGHMIEAAKLGNYACMRLCHGAYTKWTTAIRGNYHSDLIDASCFGGNLACVKYALALGCDSVLPLEQPPRLSHESLGDAYDEDLEEVLKAGARHGKLHVMQLALKWGAKTTNRLLPDAVEGGNLKCLKLAWAAIVRFGSAESREQIPVFLREALINSYQAPHLTRTIISLEPSAFTSETFDEFLSEAIVEYENSESLASVLEAARLASNKALNQAFAFSGYMELTRALKKMGASDSDWAIVERINQFIAMEAYSHGVLDSLFEMYKRVHLHLQWGGSATAEIKEVIAHFKCLARCGTASLGAGRAFESLRRLSAKNAAWRESPDVFPSEYVWPTA